MAQLVCMYIGLDPEDEGLGLYQRELEDLLLSSTKQFYDRKAKEWIANSTFAEYLQLAEVGTRQTYTAGLLLLARATSPHVAYRCRLSLSRVYLCIFL